MTVRKKTAKLLVKVISDDSTYTLLDIFFTKKIRLKPDPTPVKS